MRLRLVGQTHPDTGWCHVHIGNVYHLQHQDVRHPADHTTRKFAARVFMCLCVCVHVRRRRWSTTTSRTTFWSARWVRTTATRPRVWG